MSDDTIYCFWPADGGGAAAAAFVLGIVTNFLVIFATEWCGNNGFPILEEGNHAATVVAVTQWLDFVDTRNPSGIGLLHGVSGNPDLTLLDLKKAVSTAADGK